MRTFFLFAIYVLTANAIGCPPYEGTWESSREMTMDFNNAMSENEPKVKELLPQITGTVRIEYTDAQIIVRDIPERKIVIHGKEHDWIGFNDDVSYQLLGCTNDIVAIKYRLFDVDVIETMHFENENVYWTYLGNTNKALNAHAREYFVRSAPPNEPSQPRADAQAH